MRFAAVIMHVGYIMVLEVMERSIVVLVAMVSLVTV